MNDNVRIFPLFLYFNLVGCASYYLPATQLETAETGGSQMMGRAELTGVHTGPNLTAEPVLTSTGTSSKLPAYGPGFFFGFTKSLGQSWDVTTRFQPQAPFTLRIKKQLWGIPESEAQKGNFSGSLALGSGLLIGKNQDLTTQYFNFDFSFPVSYRLWQNDLFTLAPSYALASLSSDAVGASSASFFGLRAGYQHRIEDLYFRIELAWLTGKAKESSLLPTALQSPKLGGIYGGFVLGLILF